MLAQEARSGTARDYQVEGGSLAGKESSDEMSTISRSSSSRAAGAANAQSNMVHPPIPQPASHSEFRRVPVATSAVPSNAQSSLDDRFNGSLYIGSLLNFASQQSNYIQRPTVRFGARPIR